MKIYLYRSKYKFTNIKYIEQIIANKIDNSESGRRRGHILNFELLY